jgi:hypothetical protein
VDSEKYALNFEKEQLQNTCLKELYRTGIFHFEQMTHAQNAQLNI